jgi:hypothetical protein
MEIFYRHILAAFLSQSNRILHAELSQHSLPNHMRQ